MIKRCVFLSFCFSVSAYIVNAQQFGGNPASTKWKQINTDTVKVVFPAGLDSAAQRVANITHLLQRKYSSTIGSSLDKVNIVLQKDVTISNAFVQLGPYRSEFYLMPPQDAFELGAQNWTDNLAIHEYRHVQQYSNCNTGLSHAMGVLFGENGRSLANAAAVPDWFFEGDAVYNETLLSEQGRGRLPLFFNGYKSLFLQGRNYSYMQLRNGSFRHYIPNHYNLGYLLVAYGREKYGDDFWKKVSRDAAAYKPLFYPMQGAVKKYAGIPFNEFVQNALSYYQGKWQTDKKDLQADWITDTVKNEVVSYRYPYATEDGQIITLKTTSKDVQSICVLNKDGREKKVVTRAIAYEDYFSYNNGKVIYTALQPDLRWGNREYSDIEIADVATGAISKITHHTKYFSPDISHDGNSVAAVDIEPQGSCKLSILDVHGTVQKSFAADSAHLFSYPKFAADDASLFVMDRNAAGNMTILKINAVTGLKEQLMPYANRILGFPVVKGDTILYSASANGNDEIWAFEISSKKEYRLASFATGLYQATLSNGALVASAFTANGYRLAKMKPLWQQQKTTGELTGLYVQQPFHEADNTALQNIPTEKFAETKYHKFSHPFNFHSWIPNFSDPDYSFTIYGENVLNTIQAELYYTYNTNEKYHKVGYTGIYGGWYVQPYVSVSETFNRNYSYNADTSLKWNEMLLSAGLQLPLNLSSSRHYTSLNLLGAFNYLDYNRIQWKPSDINATLNNFPYLSTQLSFTNQVQKATQQIYAHFAQTLFVQYRTSANSIAAHQLLLNGSLYLPGLAKTHSIVLNAAYQVRDTAGQYSFTNNFPYSRGYAEFNYPQMWKLGANYHLPLFYPEWGFGNIVFFQRIRANIFYDYTNLKSLRLNTNYHLRSYGAEIYFDTKWWNQQPLLFGIRYSYLQDHTIAGASASKWEIILPVTLIN